MNFEIGTAKRLQSPAQESRTGSIPSHGRRIAGWWTARHTSPAFLVAPLLVLFQLCSAGQYNSQPNTDVHARTTSANLATIASQPFKSGNDGSIRDRSAVGKRDIGCTHGLSSRYSLQTQIEMGRSYAQQIESTFRLVTDPVINEYVNRIGQKLARNSDAHFQHTFKIVDTDELNAFSLPGGFVFVDSGLILAAENEAELAGVLSHEMAHVAACHITQEIAHEEFDASRMQLIFRLVFRSAIRNTVDLNPTRSFEFEADHLGIEYLYKTGYDPRALPTFLERVRTIEIKRGNRANVSESYPRIADRIRKAQREIDHLRPPASENKLDTSEFQEVKNRLAELERNQEGNKTQVELVRR